MKTFLNVLLGPFGLEVISKDGADASSKLIAEFPERDEPEEDKDAESAPETHPVPGENVVQATFRARRSPRDKGQEYRRIRVGMFPSEWQELRALTGNRFNDATIVRVALRLLIDMEKMLNDPRQVVLVIAEGKPPMKLAKRMRW